MFVSWPRSNSRGLGLAVAMSMLAMSISAPVLAAPAEGSQDIGSMWSEAQTRMGTADYPGAIEILTDVYRQISSDPDALALRLRVRWTLQEAHTKSYERDHELSHLQIAEDLLTGYLEELPQGEDRTSATEALSAVQQTRAKAEAEIAEAEAEAEAEARRQAEAEAEAARAEEGRDKTPTGTTGDGTDTLTPAKPAKPMLITGGVLLGVGVAAGAGAIGGFVMAQNGVSTFETRPAQREDARGTVRTGNALGGALAATGGVLVVAGAALLAIGFGRKKAARTAKLKSHATMVGGTFLPGGGGGITLEGRF